MAKYQISVGNVGNTYIGDDYDRAASDYCDYVEKSKEPGNRCTLEPVVFFEDGEPEHSFDPERDMTGEELAKAHDLKTFDFAVPISWMTPASKLADCNLSGHVVWNYPSGSMFGEPFGLTDIGRNAIEAMASYA